MLCRAMTSRTTEEHTAAKKLDRSLIASFKPQMQHIDVQQFYKAFTPIIKLSHNERKRLWVWIRNKTQQLTTLLTMLEDQSLPSAKGCFLYLFLSITGRGTGYLVIASVPAHLLGQDRRVWKIMTASISMLLANTGKECCLPATMAIDLVWTLMSRITERSWLIAVDAGIIRFVLATLQHPRTCQERKGIELVNMMITKSKIASRAGKLLIDAGIFLSLEHLLKNSNVFLNAHESCTWCGTETTLPNYERLLQVTAHMHAFVCNTLSNNYLPMRHSFTHLCTQLTPTTIAS